MNNSCIPYADGVPGMGGPPNWWDPVPAPSAPYTAASGWTAPYDPRWLGASGHGYDTGTGEESQFRALYSTGSGSTPYFLYLSFEVNNDPSADAGYDGMYVGFQTHSGAGYVMDIKAYTTPNNHDLNAGGTTVQWNTTGAVYVDPATSVHYHQLVNYAGPHPDVKASNWFRPPSALTTNNRWAVCLRIPLLAAAGPDISADGINLGNVGGGASFKFWYAIWIELPGGNAINYNWPRTAEISADASLNLVVPDFPAWGDTRLGTSLPCGSGISLSSSDIGTNNTDPVTGLPAPNKILVSLTAPPTNHFFAAPLNNDPVQTVATGSIEGRFYSADWGSTALFTSSGSTPWKEIPFSKGPGTHYTNSAAIPPGMKGQIGFDWQLSHDEAVPYLGDPTAMPPVAPTKNLHECMLVTLSNFHTGAGSGYEFINDSTYRNMDFKQASSFSDRIAISTVGVKAVPKVAKDKPVSVFIYEEKSNMPAQIKAGMTAAPNLKTLIGARPSALSMAHASVIDSLHDFDKLALVSPTLRYHVYRSRNIQVRRRGALHTLLEPQTSFGYFIQHAGPLYGWKSGLGHVDAGLANELPLKAIGGPLYQLQVPLNHSVALHSTVTSVLKKPIVSLPLGKTTAVTKAEVLPPVAVALKPMDVAVSPVMVDVAKPTLFTAPIATIKNIFTRTNIGG